MNRIPAALLSASALASLFFIGPVQAQDKPALEQGFVAPPDSAKPRTWWHWTGGNVTKDGITKDLEWMKRVGIGGMHLADVSSGSGQTIENKLVFGTPDWFDAVRHAASEADRLGLEMTIFSSAGWSETGGPWVKPEQAMKKLVWSETTVDGPRTFAEKLPQPPSSNGSFRNQGAAAAAPRAGAPPADVPYYGDSAVVAYRTPADEKNMVDFHPQVTTSGTPNVAAQAQLRQAGATQTPGAASAGGPDYSVLMDDDINTGLTITAPPEGGPAWIIYQFPQPFKARAVTIDGRGGIPVGRVMASDDGINYRVLATTPGQQLYREGANRTFAFPETTAKFYCFQMTGAPIGPAPTMSQEAPVPAASYSLTEFQLFPAGRVNRWEEKAGFSFFYQYESVPTPSVPASSEIAREDIVDLTSKMDKDGKLTWEVPPGKWTILRLGYSLTGSKNRPAPPTGSGYEVDKLNRQDVEAYFHGYTDPLEKALGPLYGKSLRYVMMDSWEAGMQNWTDVMISEFTKRRGYDPTPYLPALLGRIVVNADVSDRFLWDFRRTIADLVADNHYGTMAELLRQKGIGIYAEAAGVSMEIIEDTMLNKSKVEIPMGEFWVHALHPELQYYVDVRGAASTSHAYGKPLVATESFTGGGYEAPYTLKKIADYWFTQGVNRIVFHTSAEQPLDTKPGNTMVGTHINRNISWAELAKPFMTYLSRVMYLLQQGRFVADVAYLLPEGAPSSQPFWGGGLHPELPAGYDYDCINTDVLLNRMSVGEDGRLVLPDGMSYRVLVLPEINTMRPEVLKKIRELVVGGAIVVGQKAVTSPSLANYPQADREVQQLAADVWGDLDGVARNQRFYGKGKVVWGFPLSTVLPAAGIAKDFEFGGPLDADVPWIHRRDGDTDIYFVVNRTDRPADLQARFRVAGKEAELWHPDTGVMEPADYSIADGRTTVPLRLGERESVFVIFRKPTTVLGRTLPKATSTTLAMVSGPWDVSFPPKFGAPPSIQLPSLASWTLNADNGVKYFSGTATYTKQVDAPQSWFRPGAKILLDLGTVDDLAEVSVNGKPLATLWKQPYAVDISSALKPGANQLEVKVTNEWTNRIAGDRAGPPEQAVFPSTGAAGARGGATRGGGLGGGGGAGLPDSGLLGPVTIVSQNLP